MTVEEYLKVQIRKKHLNLRYNDRKEFFGILETQEYQMKVINIKKVSKQGMGPPLFTGPAFSRTPVTDREGADISVNFIHFPKGVRNKFHKHSNDQILIVTEGKGMVATRKKKVKVAKGDIVWAPAGEEHWHGAVPGSKFSHISVTRSGTKLTQLEK